ncbi:hypothetical protein BJV85_002849 [Clostridium acetobutylicum]|uniref:Uncharacterized protein n=1 Tax=Clostridium acetobutylicum (strain ATCC 824 / DSM 792 / JCM 1419 / IAM 19013 / LMG 5710 / NBRC 13948 / NRRL B-527 / VKM B-1787 / 2291 / W) TaxID=272562 RepID=Q97JX3_CLOAB|nr:MULTISPECIES: hypothetical protein [Clostridium]AAK79122.1 Hypothetical protein CA_C1150 [Clostridium acetobutylicum ATCC 824]ADZ20200.1 Conserved hypothetical protein [Clostridium acetobutylicum EA 2018]AEI31658.1 hypothetical protein SMB_G1170 [Clostridium acetobutylicum DSM 1731]AWV81625.1 hypothetical protein DK921_16305 [Clostridium acetobutylicum]MBC2393268.1 hypothetical protein [Clostridium acetobutylicum]
MKDDLIIWVVIDSEYWEFKREEFEYTFKLDEVLDYDKVEEIYIHNALIRVNYKNGKIKEYKYEHDTKTYYLVKKGTCEKLIKWLKDRRRSFLVYLSTH